MWVEDLKCMHSFWDVKKIISRWMLYLILCRLKWVVLHLCQLNTTRLLSKSVKWVRSGQPFLLIGWVRVEGS